MSDEAVIIQVKVVTILGTDTTHEILAPEDRKELRQTMTDLVQRCKDALQGRKGYLAMRGPAALYSVEHLVHIEFKVLGLDDIMDEIEEPQFGFPVP